MSLSLKRLFFSLELEEKNLLEEIKSLYEIQIIFIQISSSSHEVLDELIMCNQCDVLKNKIDDLENTLNKFTKWREKLNLLLGNQRGLYNKSS